MHAHEDALSKVQMDQTAQVFSSCSCSAGLPLRGASSLPLHTFTAVGAQSHAATA